jgi:hypothetical protein
MQNTYKITGYFDGVVYAQYNNGMLAMMLCELTKPLISNDNPPGWDMFPMQENDLLNCTEMFTVRELKPKSASDKLALFCFVYQLHKRTTYRTTKEDRANIVHVTVNEHLLNTYFKATAYPLAGLKSVGDYIRHYNEVRDLAANGATKKNSFPDVYDKAYEQIIGDDVTKLQRYWEHLRSLGWRKVEGVWKLAALVALMLLASCVSSKKVQHRPRYKQDPGPWMPEYVMPKKARKVKATVY